MMLASAHHDGRLIKEGIKLFFSGPQKDTEHAGLHTAG